MTSPTDNDETLVSAVDNNAAEDATVISATATDSPQPSAQLNAPAAATIIKDRFILEEKLGEGGMGQVYKARDLRKVEAQDDNPYVAIKFLGEEFSRHPNALVSLQREAKKSQQLAHPNVVTVYDFDRDGDQVYMTMELLSGTPLPGWQSLVYESDKPPAIASLVEGLASGLAYAHRLGVVHSDLKPGNVFVTTRGRVKILDFGIARIVDSAVENDSFDAGQLGALTLRYASLEMLQGGEEPHPSDDVYALGLMAYQLFSGKHPFNGKTALEALNSRLTPDPLRKIKRHQRRAIMKALALRRKHRTASADQFLKQFSGVYRRRAWVITLLVLLTASSAFFAWRSMQADGPAIPFNQLPLATQAQFTEHLSKGYQSAQIQDWDGAYRYFLASYELHPRNADAEEGLELLAQHLVNLAPTLSKPRQRKYLLSMIEAYSENEYLSTHAGLQALKKELTAEQIQ